MQLSREHLERLRHTHLSRAVNDRGGFAPRARGGQTGWPRVALVVLGAAIAGCSAPPAGGNGGANRLPADTSVPAAGANRPSAGTSMPAAAVLKPASVADLSLTLHAPDTAVIGTPVPLRLRLTNGGDGPATLELAAPIPMIDLIVTDAEGKLVWNFLTGRGIAEGARTRTLAPGESLDLTERVASAWDQRRNPTAPRVHASSPDRRRVAPGAYQVAGELSFRLGGAEHVVRSRPRRLVLVAKP